MTDVWGVAFALVTVLVLAGYATYLALGIDPVLALGLTVACGTVLAILVRCTLSLLTETADNEVIEAAEAALSRDVGTVASDERVQERT